MRVFRKMVRVTEARQMERMAVMKVERQVILERGGP